MVPTYGGHLEAVTWEQNIWQANQPNMTTAEQLQLRRYFHTMMMRPRTGTAGPLPDPTR